MCVGSWGKAGKTPHLLLLYGNGSGQSFARVRASGNHSLENEVGCTDVVVKVISLYLPDVEYQSFNAGVVPSVLFF